MAPKGSLVRTVAVLAILLFPSVSVYAKAGAELAWKYHCTTCHGLNGVANSDRYPNLAGQNAPYLELRLKYFRAKEEPGNQMNAQAAPLSDEDIAQLAKYFNGKSG